MQRQCTPCTPAPLHPCRLPLPLPLPLPLLLLLLQSHKAQVQTAPAPPPRPRPRPAPKAWGMMAARCNHGAKSHDCTDPLPFGGPF